MRLASATTMARTRRACHPRPVHSAARPTARGATSAYSRTENAIRPTANAPRKARMLMPSCRTARAPRARLIIPNAKRGHPCSSWRSSLPTAGRRRPTARTNSARRGDSSCFARSNTATSPPTPMTTTSTWSAETRWPNVQMTGADRASWPKRFIEGQLFPLILPVSANRNAERTYATSSPRGMPNAPKYRAIAIGTTPPTSTINAIRRAASDRNGARLGHRQRRMTQPSGVLLASPSRQSFSPLRPSDTLDSHPRAL